MDRKVKNQTLRIALATHGCKLNQAETELATTDFTSAGYEVVPPDSEADVYLLNTCTVTHTADAKARKWLRAVRQRSPGALLVACGCYARRAATELKATGVNIIVDNETKSNLPELVGKYLDHSHGTRSSPIGLLRSDPRTRSMVKIQDGCQNFCAYCVVPTVRSREVSIAPSGLISQIKQRVKRGYREVVLTGTRIGSYERNDTNLSGLIKRILAETAVERLRLSSLQPQEISKELIDLWGDPRLCRHFHLSLQNGSDGVLKRMNRRYTTGDYQRALSLIRQQSPQAAITTDIIVGFPGETEAEFETSYRFSREQGFARIHVFPYSRRKGTAAAGMKGQIPEVVKKQRLKKMLSLARESRSDFNRRFLKQTMSVLWETRYEGIWQGLTDNYLKIYTKSAQDLSNRLLRTKLIELGGDGMWGELIPLQPPGKASL